MTAIFGWESQKQMGDFLTATIIKRNARLKSFGKICYQATLGYKYGIDKEQIIDMKLPTIFRLQ
jgi:hypothetical protein